MSRKSSPPLPGAAALLTFALAFLSAALVSGAVFFPNAAPLSGRASDDFTPPCAQPGWFPAEFGLKDHHIFRHDGYYYLVSIYAPGEEIDPLLQDRFVYARSSDLCTWEELAPILQVGESDPWTAVWAPFVVQEGSAYYLFYTAVTEQFNQRILLAVSNDPSDPGSWARQEGFSFHPDHEGMLWDETGEADCRDPMVLEVGGNYYLYYAGRDVDGYIIGAASAASLTGPWNDLGRAAPAEADAMLESPTVASREGTYYLFFNRSRIGEFYRVSTAPLGDWSGALPFRPGWAHEVWQASDGSWFTSYLTDLTVSIDALTWDTDFDPPQPFIGEAVWKGFLPLVGDRD